jgi:hypothetical protein
MDVNLNPLLTQFLHGKYNRSSIRDALEGLTVADLSGCCYDMYIATIQAKDRLVAEKFWHQVLTPVRLAWTAYEIEGPRRQAIEQLRQNLLQVINQNIEGCANNHINVPANNQQR